MHAKVFIGVRKDGPFEVIVGSANLSAAALTRDTEDTQGQWETAVHVTTPSVVAEVADWFLHLWNDHGTRVVDEDALARAEAAWSKRRRRGRGGGGSEAATRGGQVDPSWIPRDGVRFQRALEWARTEPLIDAIGRDAVETARAIDPKTMSKAHLEELIEKLKVWYPDIGRVRKSLDEPLAKIRASFTRMTNTAVPVVDRLRHELRGGPSKLRGFRVPTWSTFLYWRHPEDTPPLNGRTYLVASELGRAAGWPKSPSAVTYEEWLDLAEELRAAWRLPTIGHVDRVVFAYTENQGVPGPRDFGDGEE